MHATPTTHTRTSATHARHTHPHTPSQCTPRACPHARTHAHAQHPQCPHLWALNALACGPSTPSPAGHQRSCLPAHASSVSAHACSRHPCPRLATSTPTRACPQCLPTRKTHILTTTSTCMPVHTALNALNAPALNAPALNAPTLNVPTPALPPSTCTALPPSMPTPTPTPTMRTHPRHTRSPALVAPASSTTPALDAHSSALIPTAHPPPPMARMPLRLDAPACPPSNCTPAHSPLPSTHPCPRPQHPLLSLGSPWLHARQALLVCHANYVIGDFSITSLAWSPVAPATLIIADSLSRLHILIVQERALQNLDHDRLARYQVIEIIDTGLGAIWSIDVYKHLVAIGGDKGIKVMEHKPGTSLSAIARLPPPGTPLEHPFALCPNSVHIYNPEILIATYNVGHPYNIIAWNIANEELIWGVTLSNVVTRNGLNQSSLSKHHSVIMSTNISSGGLNWYYLNLFTKNPTKVVCRTTELDVHLAAFINDKLVAALDNEIGCIHILEAVTGLPITMIKNPPHEEKAFYGPGCHT
ncbi:hypothetical protein OF83DRAFT_1176978 [Amylostereum chailletii]|nr:hypothetical protein OF83DRAFT_1176978 [Amylostereum chailletii]